MNQLDQFAKRVDDLQQLREKLLFGGIHSFPLAVTGVPLFHDSRGEDLPFADWALC